MARLSRLLAASAVLSRAVYAALDCSVSALSGILPENATVLSAESVPQGGSYGQGPADIAYPTNPTNLPALCAALGSSTLGREASGQNDKGVLPL